MVSPAPGNTEEAPAIAIPCLGTLTSPRGRPGQIYDPGGNELPPGDPQKGELDPFMLLQGEQNELN